MAHATERKINHASRPRRLQNATLRAAALWLVLPLLSPFALWAQARPSEYRVKAVYLYNFGKFVQWPAGRPGPFSVCVLGQDPFGSLLEEVLKGTAIGGQPLVARRIDRAEDAANCRILFISSSEEDRLGRVLDVLENQPVLTVSDVPAFCNRGGMIQFVVQQDKVRFEVNVAPAAKAGLMLSSQLLKVATSVLGQTATTR